MASSPQSGVIGRLSEKIVPFSASFPWSEYYNFFGVFMSTSKLWPTGLAVLLLLCGLGDTASAGSAGVRFTDATAVTAGSDHSCALRKTTSDNDFAAYCWGSDSAGQLGTSAGSDSPTPVPVTGMFEDVAQISAGSEHTCAVKQDGSLWCWGLNGAGQLGLGDKLDRNVPTQVTLPANKIALYVRSGARHTCALLDTIGSTSPLEAYCWGENTFGQLATGDQTERLTPTKTSIVSAVSDIAVNGAHSCAIIGREVHCWGSGFNGQVGNGSSALVNTAIELVIDSAGDVLDDGITVDVGSLFSCATFTRNVPTIGSQQQTHCWGDNSTRQLARSDVNLNSNRAVQVLTGSSIVVTGEGFACAHDPSPVSTLRCWGDNEFGQLGRGTTGGSDSSVDQAFNVSVVDEGLIPSPTLGADERLALGRAHACAVVGASDGSYTNGNIKCWGANNAGQLGDGSTLDSNSAGFVGAPPPRPVGLDFRISPSAPAVFGDPITLELTIVGENPSGTVDFARGFTTVCADVEVIDSEAGCVTDEANAGAGSFSANYSGDLNNASGSIVRAYTISKATQTISFPQPATQTFLQNGTFPISATASSGLPVSFVSLDSSICSVASSTVTMLNPGTCLIEALQPGNNNYLSASTVTRSIQLASGPAQSNTELIITPASPAIFGQSIRLDVTVTGNAPTGTVEFRLGPTTRCTGVPLVDGQASCIIDEADAGSMLFGAFYSGDTDNEPSESGFLPYTIDRADQTIRFFPPSGLSFVAGGSFALDGTASSGLSVDYFVRPISQSICSVSGSTLTMLSEGDCTIEAAQMGNNNYNMAQPVERTIELSSDIVFHANFE